MPYIYSYHGRLIAYCLVLGGRPTGALPPSIGQLRSAPYYLRRGLCLLAGLFITAVEQINLFSPLITHHSGWLYANWDSAAGYI